MGILDITEPIPEGANADIDEYEVHEYEPITGTNLNNSGGHIRINIETQDLFTHPSESYLIFTGQLVRNDNGAAYGNNSNISLTNNGLMYLFKNIKYELSGKEIESLANPGQATTMLGLLKYPDDFSKSQGLNQLWIKDTRTEANADNTGFKERRRYIIRDPVPNGTFSFKVPLKDIFGFCEDYNKVLYGMKQTLTLTRTEDGNAIFKAAPDGGGNPVDGRVTLHKISWYMPHVMPADDEKMKLYKLIEKKEKFPVRYRMIQCDSIQVPQALMFIWRLSVKSSPEVPRFIIIGFQTNRHTSNQTINTTIFDYLNVKNIYVMLNSARYPETDYDLSFPEHQFSRAYGDAALFRSKFYKMDKLVSNPNISPTDYKTLYPLFVFDVSKQSERLKYSTTDIRVKAFFNANVLANTEAYAVIISDRLLSFQSDGNKMSVVF